MQLDGPIALPKFDKFDNENRNIYHAIKKNFSELTVSIDDIQTWFVTYYH